MLSSSKIWIFFLFALALTLGVCAQTVRVIDNKGTIQNIDQSKWKQVGNDIYNKNTTGNVGIGTSTPMAKFDNEGSTILGSTALSNFTTNSTLTASATVDAFSGAVITQTTPGISLTLPSPTNSTAGRIFQVSNSNTSVPITVGGVTLAPGNSTLFRWDGGAWNTLTATTSANDWHLTGNSNTIPIAVGASYPTALSSSNSWIGTIDANDFIIGANSKERFRVTSGGNIGIGITSGNNINSNYLMTINPNSTIGNGISMNLSGASSSVYGLNINTGTSAANGVLFTSTSTGSGFYGLGSVLSSTNIVSGYLGYRNGSGVSYGLYGVGNTNVSTYAAFLQGRMVISSELAPSSPIGVDLEIRNTTSGSASPATLSLRQTTSSATVLSNINFGDNNQTSPQAQIQAVRDVTSTGSSDLPTALTFSTTMAGSATMAERMRISNAGNVGIGTNNPQNKVEITQGTAGNSGLRLTNLLSTTTPIANPGTGVLSVNSSGDVILVPSGNSALTKNSVLSGSTALTVTNGNNQIVGGSDLTLNIANYVGASSSIAGTAGLVNPAPAGQQNYLYQGNGSWVNPNSSLTTKNVTTSTPAITLGNASGQVVGSNNLTIDVANYSGATVSTAGVPGLVPSATTTQTGYVLNGAGNWVSPNNALTKGDLTTSTTALTIGNGTGIVLGSGSTVNYNLVSGIGALVSGTQGTLGGGGTSNTYIGADGLKHLLPIIPLLSTLTDATITTPTANQLLQYNGSKWVNWTPNYMTGNQTITLSGDVTGSGATSISTTIANDAVTSAKILDGTIATADLATGSVTTAKMSSGAAANGQVLIANGTGGVSFGNLPASSITGNNFTSTDLNITNGTGATLTNVTADIKANAITYAKFQKVAANSLVGNPMGLAANAQEITLGSGLSFSGTTLTNSGILSVTGTSPITANTTIGATTIGIIRNNIVSGTSSGSATSPLTLDAGATNAVVGGANATLTVNNTAPLWNANQLLGKNISSTPPTNGYILAYNSTTSQWEPTANSGSGWLLTGNAGTTPGPNFLGTTDDKDLVLKTNNTESGRLSVYQFSTSFGIGATAANSGTAIGKSANAAQNGIALGTSSSTGYQALAVGYSAAAAGQSSVALGDQTSASAYQSIAIGNLAQAQTHDQTIAIGVSANASGYQSTSLGSGAKATAQNSTAIGNGTIADNANTVILGSGANVGIGTSAPQNKLEITQGTDGNSGLRLTNLKSASLLGTDANGDVITASASNVPNIYTANGNLGGARTVGLNGNALTFRGTKDVVIDKDGNLTAGGTLGVTGASTLGSTLSVAGNITQTGATTFSTGTGAVSLNGNTTLASGKTLTLTGSTSGTATITAPATISTAYTLTLPTSAGSAGQVLQTDGTGVTSWANPTTLPKWFYLPQTPINTAFASYPSSKQTLNLYTLAQQLETAGMLSTTTAATTYKYYVVSYDTSVFGSINIDQTTGIMTYTVLAPATDATYMNLAASFK